MGKYGKWIGGALGWAFGGPLGAILGVALGSMFDNTSVVKSNERVDYEQYRHHTQPGDFAASLMAVTAVVMKADGKVLKSELDFVKKFLVQNFGEAQAKSHLKVLKELLNRDFSIRPIAEQIRHFMEHPMRLQMLHYLFGIAKADGNVDENEFRTIHTIAMYMGISEKDFQSIQAMFYSGSVESAYKILEIEENASASEVKKAYRKMAIKYHPDKVTSLGEEYKLAATEKFQKVQDAYEKIKKQRSNEF